MEQKNTEDNSNNNFKNNSVIKKIFKSWWLVLLLGISTSLFMYFYTLFTYVPFTNTNKGPMLKQPALLLNAALGALIGIITGVLIVLIFNYTNKYLRKSRNKINNTTVKRVDLSNLGLYSFLLAGMIIVLIGFWGYLYPVFKTSSWIIGKENTNKPTITKNVVPIIKGKVNIIYPEFGTQYANLVISSAGIDKPIYFGDSKEELSKGIGHFTGSYMPGEGATIIYSGHNNATFKELGLVKVGDDVLIKTNYGEFKYKVTEAKIVNTNQTQYLQINKDKEELVMYTCYPFTALGLTSQRFIVIADIINQ